MNKNSMLSLCPGSKQQQLGRSFSMDERYHNMITMCLLLCVVPFIIVLQQSRWTSTRIVWLLNPLEVVKKNEGLPSKQETVFCAHHFGVKPLGGKTVCKNINTYYLFFLEDLHTKSVHIVLCLHRL